MAVSKNSLSKDLLATATSLSSSCVLEACLYLFLFLSLSSLGYLFSLEYLFPSLLQKEISTLSKTIVYNTLRMLSESALVQIVAIEDKESRYDLITESHGHFKCESCGMIYDFGIDMDFLTSKDLSGFKIHNKNVYFKGICQRCLVNIEENE